MEKNNLVYLIFHEGGNPPELAEKIPEDVSVNISDSSWKYLPNQQKCFIGQERKFDLRESLEGQTIGVYDRTDINHLRSMNYRTHASIKARLLSEGKPIARI